jgi:flavin-dependent dehydrogenase
VGLPIDRLAGGAKELRRLLGEYTGSLGRFGVTVGDPSSVRAHQLPHSGGSPRLAYDRLALVGDAAAIINPLSGEGIAYAMEASTLLARHVAANPPGGDSVALRRWARELGRAWRVHQASSLASWRFVAGPFGPRLLAAAVRDDVVIGDAALMLFDHGRLRVGTGVRLAARGLTAPRAK